MVKRKYKKKIEKALQQNPDDALNFGRTALASENYWLKNFQMIRNNPDKRFQSINQGELFI